MITKRPINKQDELEAELADAGEELEDTELKEMGEEETASPAVKKTGTDAVEAEWDEEWDEKGLEVEEL